MKSFLSTTALINLVLVLLGHLSVLVVSLNDYDFFYFVQQWPGSYCDTKKSCCYPKTGKPLSDFGIHGLWPNYNDGTYPSNCDPQNPFNQSKISDLTTNLQRNWPTLACPSGDGTKFWQHEWEKHGTCSEDSLDQHDYFQTALNLKQRLNLLQVLNDTGIEPNGEFYSLGEIKKAIKNGIGYNPWIECNVDKSGNSQLYQIYLCLDKTGLDLIECPIFPHGKCDSQIQFPLF